MGVRRFRDVSEMEHEVWFSRNDPRRFAAMKSAWDFAQRTLRPRFPPGVHRCRSAAEAAEQRELWERQNLDEFQRRRIPEEPA